MIKAIGNRRLTHEELLTFLPAVEAVLNSRPITFIYENDCEEPLTPSHLYCGRRLLNEREDTQYEHVEGTDYKVSHKSMVQKVGIINAAVEHFWTRWHREYLSSLREVHKIVGGKENPGIEVGDVVVVQEDGVKRNKWKLGRIEELITGKDQVIRGAIVRTNKGGKAGHISRPLQKLCPLETKETKSSEGNKEQKLSGKEIEANAVSSNQKKSYIDSGVPLGSNYGTTSRQRRDAAIKGEYHRRLNNLDI